MIEVNLHPARTRGARAGQGELRRKVAGLFRGASPGRDPWEMGAILAVVVAGLGVGTLWFMQRSRASDLHEHLAVAVKDSTRVADLRALSDSLEARDKLIRERLALVERLDHDRFVWPHLMDEFSRALPDFTWLTLLKLNAPPPNLTVEVQGVAANPLAITAYVHNLQASPYVGEVRLMGSEQQEVGDLVAQAFTLHVLYSEPPPSMVSSEPFVATGS